ncbi:MAG: hypothetical protein V4530_07840 [Pseudomonadota bacterium]
MARLTIRNFAVAAVLCSGTMLASCMENMPGPNRPGGMCPAVHAPVCAAKGRQHRTFDNSCLAQRRGWSVVSEGNCMRPMGR